MLEIVASLASVAIAGKLNENVLLHLCRSNPLDAGRSPDRMTHSRQYSGCWCLYIKFDGIFISNSMGNAVENRLLNLLLCLDICLSLLVLLNDSVAIAHIHPIARPKN